MVTVIGLGFVGLTTALGFAELGNQVCGQEVSAQRRNMLQSGKIDFQEEMLPELLQKHLGHSFLLGPSLGEAVASSELVFLCVGTPCQNDGAVDLTQLTTAVKEIMAVLPDDGMFRVLVVKSTVPPGTCRDVVEPMIRAMGIGSERIAVAGNPEFLREGHCWEDFVDPGKIVIGVNDSRAEKKLRALYAGVNAPLHVLTQNGAEFSKYLSNVMLASMISLSNEFAAAAESFGDIDIKGVFRALHDDKRLKNSGIASYLYPGCGFGGYCLPKDTRAFYAALEKTGYHSMLVNEVLAINERAAERLCRKVLESTDVRQPIGILGLSFKPGSDDVRDTPAARIITKLMKGGAERILAYDPLAIPSFKRAYPDLQIGFAESAEELLSACGTVVVVTAWEEFRTLDYTGKTLFDGRYCVTDS